MRLLEFDDLVTATTALEGEWAWLVAPVGRWYARCPHRPALRPAFWLLANPRSLSRKR